MPEKWRTVIWWLIFIFISYERVSQYITWLRVLPPPNICTSANVIVIIFNSSVKKTANIVLFWTKYCQYHLFLLNLTRKNSSKQSHNRTLWPFWEKKTKTVKVIINSFVSVLLWQAQQLKVRSHLQIFWVFFKRISKRRIFLRESLHQYKK